LEGKKIFSYCVAFKSKIDCCSNFVIVLEIVDSIPVLI